jgi:hypothetical protein
MPQFLYAYFLSCYFGVVQSGYGLGDLQVIKCPAVLNIFWHPPKYLGAFALQAKATAGHFIIWKGLGRSKDAHWIRQVGFVKRVFTIFMAKFIPKSSN